MQGTDRTSRRNTLSFIAIAALATILIPLLDGSADAAGTLDRIRAAGGLKLGYRTDARPFSYDDSGKAAGYSVALCEKVADEVKSQLKLPAIAVDWIPIKVEDRISAIQQNKIDLLCGADTVTLAKRKDVSFSLPIFPSGIGAIVRSDSPIALQHALNEEPASELIWRGSPAQILSKKTFSVVAGTTSETWLKTGLDKFQIDATVVPVPDYATGIQSVLDRTSDAFFADRSILVQAESASSSAGNLFVLDRRFTYEPLALTLSRNDDDFRLVVDTVLSHEFASPDFAELFVKWFGTPESGQLAFFNMIALPE